MSCQLHQPAIDTTLKRLAGSMCMYRIGTSVPYSRSSVVLSWARVNTPSSVATSAISRPSAGLPSYWYGMFWMKWGSSLLV